MTYGLPGRSVGRPALIVMWSVAILVTLVGGSPQAMNWQNYIQLPGSVVVLYLGWLIGPLQVVMSPIVEGMFTILINVAAYYLLVKSFLYFREKLSGAERRDVDHT